MTGTMPNGIRHETPDDAALAAFMARDASRDGAFVAGVRTTRIYCRPSCPARRPTADRVVVFADGGAARLAGYRACKRCRPDDVARDRAAIERALALIDHADAPPGLTELAAQCGYSPTYFQKLFKALVGVSPATYARARRAERLGRALAGGGRVTDAIHDAGFETSGRAYAAARERLGMTPTRWKNGGAGERIRFAVAMTSLGPLLVAATDTGLCRIAFDEDEAALRSRFPGAEIVAPDDAFAANVAAVVALVECPGRPSGIDLPVDVRGTAFQQAVWQALRAIPPGETVSYATLAARVGRPSAVRATGSACGDNGLAVLIPCHRVLRTDGSLGGYAYGLERKKALLEREKE